MATTEPRFGSSRIGELEIRHRDDVPAALVAQAIELHRENFARGRDACLKWGPGSSVSRVLIRRATGPLDLAVKWVPWRGWRGALSDALRGSRAARAHTAAVRVAAAGLLQPELLARADRVRAGFVRESFLLTRFVPDADPLPVAVARLRESPGARHALARRVGETLGALHAAGLDHRDLKHSNLLVDAQGRVALLDLEAVAPLAAGAWRRRARALGQLEAFARDLYPWLPREERGHFLAGYLRAEPGLAPRARELMQRAERYASRRMARWARRTRPPERHFPLAPRDTIPCRTADAVESASGLAAPGPACDSRLADPRRTP